LSPDLKWIDRGFESEFIQRIHSSFALTSVQPDSFPAAMSTVHFGVRTAGAGREAAGRATDAKNKEAQRAPVNPQQTIEDVIVRNSSLIGSSP